METTVLCEAPWALGPSSSQAAGRVAGAGILCQEVVCTEAVTSLKKLAWKIQVGPGRDKRGKGIWLVDRQV